uniref:Uncharacterized protein n=1 Tax=Glossina austeni TaxID=7395 RepID=A0A1A9UD55_GLOAU
MSKLLYAVIAINESFELKKFCLSYEMNHDMKFPPDNDALVELLFKMVHDEDKQWSPRALLAIIRQRFWPIKVNVTGRTKAQKRLESSKVTSKLLIILAIRLRKVRNIV